MARSRRSARVLAVLVVATLLVSLLPATTTQAVAAPRAADRPSRLSVRGAELLAQAREEGRATVVIIIATKTSRGDNVARDIEALGGTIVSKDNALGYVAASMPTDQVKAASSLADVDIVDLDEQIAIDPPVVTDGDGGVGPDVLPGPGTGAENPYMPTRDIGAPQFVAAHPTWDGRGTVIGFLDTGIDLFHPALQTTTTGARKVIDWVTATHPIVDGANDKSWIRMTAQVAVVGGSFTVGTTTYTGAPDGGYRFGVFAEAGLAVAGATEYDVDCDPLPPAGPPPADQHVRPGPDVNRNGTCDEEFAVLWRTTDDTVWVDSNADRSFSSELAMHEYKQTFDIGTFGADNPATPLRETVPFTVQVDGKNKYVNIGIVSGAHGTHTAGISAAKDLFGSVADGVAPGAQLVAVRVCLFVNACTARALIDGMIYAAKQANVDVINMSIGGLPTLNDGNNSRALLYNRLIEQSNVQMFLSAGNSGPGMNTVGDPSVATLAMSVGAYVHSDTWRENYGATAAKTDGMFVFSSRGPREDGGFKPDIVAPGSAVSTIPGWEQNFPIVGPLPPGYDMFNGTSMAAPQAAGGAALLVSAAKQSGIQHQPAQLRQAMKSSARYLPYYGAAEQGNGLVSVGAAWDLLKTNIKTVEITSSVLVNTLLSPRLATPNVGVGIHDREGVLAGSTHTRTYTFTRTKGGSGAISYALSWVGNDGTFSSPSSISLALNKPTTLTVTITPTTAGLHSAILNLDDPATVGIDYQTMNAVMAALPLNASNNFLQTVTGAADRPDTNKPRHFFAVPTGTTMIRVTATVLTGRMRMLRQHPYGFSFDSTNTTAYCTAPCSVTRTFTPTSSTPAAGTWEVTMDASRTSPTTPATYTLTIEAFSVTIDPTSWTVTGATIPSVPTQSFTATNNGTAFTGNMAGTALTSAFEESSVTFNAGGAEQVRFIDLPAGATRLTVQTFQNAGPTADLDLYLYDCTTGTCVLRGASESATANETISITTGLNAGQWKTIVVPFSIPSGTTSYRYLDEYSKSGLGTIAVADAPALRPTGTSWSATATATLSASPGTGRFLRGFVNIVMGTTTLASAEARFIP